MLLRLILVLLISTSTAFCRPSGFSKFNSSPVVMSAAAVDTTSTKKVSPPAIEIPSALKLVIGAGGIYSAFLYYGTLQEDVFHYKAADGGRFKEGT
jgi:hypothetical protein